MVMSFRMMSLRRARRRAPGAEKPTPIREGRHACTAFVTYVHLGADLRPRPCSPYTPTTAGARRRWEAALGRRAQRLERVKGLKAMLLNERG